MFSPNDIAEYYGTTFNHYKRWWNLKGSLSYHYGIREPGIKSFAAALENTNRVLMNIAQIKGTDKILDAGCGVGGSAFFLNREKNSVVVGISLSDKQINFAREWTKKMKLSEKLSFKVMDYMKTNFEDESFDVVWACESVCHAPDKGAFFKEAFRLLKKDGRIIMSDFFLTAEGQKDTRSWIKKWGDAWSVSNFLSCTDVEKNIKSAGFTNIQLMDYTPNIKRSSKRMYYASLLGAVPSELYNRFHPKVSRFAKTHYKCGYYQYRALKRNLWKYLIILAMK
jgi:tocopherol O-methyltransferase